MGQQMTPEQGLEFVRVIEQPVVVFDFETTGLTPARGDRVIEIGAVLVDGGCIIDRFESLINPGMAVSPFIEGLTGISNAMLRRSPEGAEVMERFAGFMGAYPLLAHNAPFDGRFLDAELSRIDRPRLNALFCTLRIARCLYPHIRSHKLESMVRYKNLALSGSFHRALADAEMTAQLWLAMLEDIRRLHAITELTWQDVQDLRPVSKSRALACFS